MSEPDPYMLRRAATACRNAQRSMRFDGDWFTWVPECLDRLAFAFDQTDPLEPPDTTVHAETPATSNDTTRNNSSPTNRNHQEGKQP